ncbi:MAG: hypothetical protein J6B45_01875 [Clostridia bacterium]|nr:hypothetical protein [Clostridia bacterium]
MFDKIFSLVVTILGLLLSIALLLFCIYCYFWFDVDYSELTYSQLTFKEYKVAHVRGEFYEIYFQEYEDPFEISVITAMRTNKTALKSLKANDTVDVYFCENSSSKYNYTICEIKCGSTIPVALRESNPFGLKWKIACLTVLKKLDNSLIAYTFLPCKPTYFLI